MQPVPVQNLPSSATEYARDQRTEIGAAVSALERIWRRMGDDFDASWAAIGPQLLQVLDLAQSRVTSGALAYMPEVMAQVGLDVPPSDYDVEPNALVGSAGDGRSTEGLLYHGVIEAKTAVAAGATTAQALATAGQFLTMAAGTVLSDTGRTAEKMAGHARRVGLYTRMLAPPSCGRCVILAGTETSARTAFKRHPGCDCRNIPSSEATADDVTVGVEDYLDSLDDAQLAKALGSKANAEAYKLGADPIQIVNSYRSGVRPAQQFGQRIKYTLEGTTRRGLAYRAMSAAGVRGGSALRVVGDRSVTVRNIRLMPETILARAQSREEALQMLRDYGWIRPAQPGFIIRDGAFVRVR